MIGESLRNPEGSFFAFLGIGWYFVIYILLFGGLFLPLQDTMFGKY